MAEEKKEVQEVPRQPKPKYTFLRSWNTAKKEYKTGDTISHENENVIAYLKTNKYIK